MNDILNKSILLVLNRNWQAVCARRARRGEGEIIFGPFTQGGALASAFAPLRRGKRSALGYHVSGFQPLEMEWNGICDAVVCST